MHFLKPITIGNKVISNRLVMAPMETAHNNADGSVNQDMIDYYVARAKGGTGMIIVQNAAIDHLSSRSAQCQLLACSNHYGPGLSKLAEAIKLQGAVAVVQLGHGGRQAKPQCLVERRAVAPSAVASTCNNTIPRELSVEEIIEIEKAWAEAAIRVKNAGFDGVEIHSAHGYLMSEFISPNCNKRKDQYGGSFENRCLFPLEVLARVREAVGGDFIVGIRINGAEFLPDGMNIEDAVEYAKVLEATGQLDYIHVSAGTYESKTHLFPVGYYGSGHLLPYAAAIKKAVKDLPVIAVGAINVTEGEKALAEGKADMIAIGRGLVADPEIGKKLQQNRIADIKPCLHCNEGCLARVGMARPMRCSINPTVGREREWMPKRTSNPKRVVVAGGGIAGIEAACLCAKNGHEVILMEQEDHLGGHLLEAGAPEFKGFVKDYYVWAIREAQRYGIDIRLNTKATANLILGIKPDVLIISVGSSYIVPAGVSGRIITAKEALLGEEELGENVIVIGGGTVGCETAMYLYQKGKKVTIVEMCDSLMIGQEGTSRAVMTDMLDKSDIRVLTGYKLTSAYETKATCVDPEGNKLEIMGDSVLYCLGMKARNEMVEAFRSCAGEVYIIGDCASGHNIYEAVEDAWRAVLSI